MTRYSRKKGNNAPNRRAGKRTVKTKNRVKDLDEIHDDIQCEESGRGTKREIDYDLPGDGQFYCIQCARYFINDHSLKEHIKSKVHKKRVKELDDVPYSQEEAESAAGFGNYQRNAKRLKVNDEMSVN